jgi:GNAT superfamily N-acetyltransferase
VVHVKPAEPDHVEAITKLLEETDAFYRVTVFDPFGQRAGLLMRSLCEVAVRHKCSRVEWMTDTDNPDAQRFYEALGVPRDSSKIFYRLAGEGLRQAAETP